jgi:hypothetical protein
MDVTEILTLSIVSGYKTDSFSRIYKSSFSSGKRTAITTLDSPLEVSALSLQGQSFIFGLLVISKLKITHI